MTRGQSDINKGNKVKMKVGRFFNGCDDGFMDLYKCQTYRSVCFNYVHFTASNYVLKCKNIFKIKWPRRAFYESIRLCRSSEIAL